MIALNFRRPSPSTLLKNSDPPPIFPSPPPFYFMSSPLLHVHVILVSFFRFLKYVKYTLSINRFVIFQCKYK
jgi:hypothetical protein